MNATIVANSKMMERDMRKEAVRHREQKERVPEELLQSSKFGKESQEPEMEEQWEWRP